MKEKKRTILFLAILFSLTLANLIKPRVYFSPKENRYLQALPELSYKSILSGDYGRDFETYTSDQFIGRDFWVSSKTLADLSLLKKDNGRVYFGQDNYLIDKEIGLDKEQFKKNMANINKFLDNITGTKDVTILLIPSKGEVLKDKLPAYAPILDEEEQVARIRKAIKPKAKVLDLIQPLRLKSHEDIYYRTDHHWTSKGAFYAYEYFLQSKGIEGLKEDDLIISRVSQDFLGTSYRKANLYLGQADSIYKYSPKEEVEYNLLINGQIETKDLYDNSYLNKVDKYSYFLGGDKALIEISTSTRNGKTIMIFKDSFANSFTPFLINHYEKIILLDTRYYNRSFQELIDEKKPDEILLLYNIGNFVAEKSFSNFSK